MLETRNYQIICFETRVSCNLTSSLFLSVQISSQKKRVFNEEEESLSRIIDSDKENASPVILDSSHEASVSILRSVNNIINTISNNNCKQR